MVAGAAKVEAVKESADGRPDDTATVLANGLVLVVGGWGGEFDPSCLDSAELYEPSG